MINIIPRFIVQSNYTETKSISVVQYYFNSFMTNGFTVCVWKIKPKNESFFITQKIQQNGI